MASGKTLPGLLKVETKSVFHCRELTSWTGKGHYQWAQQSTPEHLTIAGA